MLQKTNNEGGYFLVSRMIFESAIWRENPHVLKLFLWAVGNARYKKLPKKYPNFEIKRGEIVTSLGQIAEDNEYLENGVLKKWSRQKVSRMLEMLNMQNYIKLRSDTYGTHISICNYDAYQAQDNYRSDGCGTGVEHNGRGIRKKDKKDKKDKNVKKEKLLTSEKYSEARRLSDLLLKKIILNNPNFKKPNLDSWIQEIEKMIRLDNRDPEHIEKNIEFSQNDSFWKTNILSACSLRRQHDQLWIKSKITQDDPETDEDFLDRLEKEGKFDGKK